MIDGKDLYVTVAPDMWRLRDKNGDGIADEKESMSHGYGVHIGFSGHGMSGVEMGPDGRIYWQIGDIGFNGTDKTGKNGSSRTAASLPGPTRTAAISRYSRMVCATRMNSCSTNTAT